MRHFLNAFCTHPTTSKLPRNILFILQTNCIGLIGELFFLKQTSEWNFPLMMKELAHNRKSFTELLNYFYPCFYQSILLNWHQRQVIGVLRYHAPSHGGLKSAFLGGKIWNKIVLKGHEKWRKFFKKMLILIVFEVIVKSHITYFLYYFSIFILLWILWRRRPAAFQWVSWSENSFDHCVCCWYTGL